MITIKDVAKLSGVSISTVSRVINDSKPVSPEVRKKVLSVIEETGYKPNDVARSLVTRRSYLIGVFIIILAQSYVADIVRGIEEIGKMYDYDILLCSSYFSKDAQKKYLQLLDRKQAEGIFLVGHSFDDEILDLAKSLNKPCVYFTKKTRNDMEHICIDNFAASYEATNYLIKQGHKRIATISGPDKSGSGHERLSGYKEALEKYKALDIKPDHDPNPTIDVIKVLDEEDFDVESPFNLIGEISVGIDIMEIIRQDVERAYAAYYIENH